MSHSELTALVVYLTAMSFSPGPNTALSAAIASRHGLPSAMLVARLGLVLPVMMVSGFTSNLTYAVVGSALRSWLHGRRLLFFNRSLAVLIGMTACWMLWTSGLAE